MQNLRQDNRVIALSHEFRQSLRIISVRIGRCIAHFITNDSVNCFNKQICPR